MNIIDTVKNLHLPLDSYIVFGSGPMAVHGLRESSDIDLFVTQNLYEKIKNDSWEEKVWPSGDTSLTKDNIEIFNSWNFGDYRPKLGNLLANAETINGIPFVQLSEVLKWKLTFGREKDLQDALLIKDYLKLL